MFIEQLNVLSMSLYPVSLHFLTCQTLSPHSLPPSFLVLGQFDFVAELARQPEGNLGGPLAINVCRDSLNARVRCAAPL